MHHTRKTRNIYKSFPKPDRCQFCHPADLENIVEETAHARVVANRVFYDFWEARRVVDHLMVIPKRHVDSLAELSDAEQLEIMKLIATFEARHYDVYARSPASGSRSVAHQHTHLIKTEPKKGRLLFYIRRPYLLVRL